MLKSPCRNFLLWDSILASSKKPNWGDINLGSMIRVIRMKGMIINANLLAFIGFVFIGLPPISPKL
jgi:hypothetical protein